jgi:hypothetical protein
MRRISRSLRVTGDLLYWSQLAVLGRGGRGWRVDVVWSQVSAVDENGCAFAWRVEQAVILIFGSDFGSSQRILRPYSIALNRTV